MYSSTRDPGTLTQKAFLTSIPFTSFHLFLRKRHTKEQSEKHTIFSLPAPLFRRLPPAPSTAPQQNGNTAFHRPGLPWTRVDQGGNGMITEERLNAMLEPGCRALRGFQSEPEPNTEVPCVVRQQGGGAESAR